jgi:hypothetical protein
MYTLKHTKVLFFFTVRIKYYFYQSICFKKHITFNNKTRFSNLSWVERAMMDFLVFRWVCDILGSKTFLFDMRHPNFLYLFNKKILDWVFVQYWWWNKIIFADKNNCHCFLCKFYSFYLKKTFHLYIIIFMYDFSFVIY